MKSFFLFALLFKVLLCIKVVFAIDFVQLEAVITELEKQPGYANGEAWLVIVADEPYFKTGKKTVEPTAQKPFAEQLSEPDLPDLRIKGFQNEAGLIPLTSVEKKPFVRKSPTYAELFFGEELSVFEKNRNFYSPESPQKEEELESEQYEPLNRVRRDFFGESDKPLQESFKNRRRPKRRQVSAGVEQAEE